MLKFSSVLVISGGQIASAKLNSNLFTACADAASDTKYLAGFLQ